MQINITLTKARVYDIDRVDVAVDEPFTLTIVEPQTEKVRWFVDNDPVLDIEVSDDASELTITARKPGTSTILIMSNNYTLLKLLTINVLSNITPIATKLDVTVGEPVSK